MSKSAEEFQREMLKMCSKDDGQSPVFEALFTNGAAGKVSKVLDEGSNLVVPASPSVVTDFENLDSDDLDSDNIRQFEQYYDHIFEKHFRRELFPDAKATGGAFDIYRLIRFRRERVKWVDTDISENEFQVRVSGDSPAKKKHRRSFVTILPKAAFDFINKDLTMFAHIPEKNADICLLKAAPVNEQWGAIILAGVLTGLDYRAHAINNPQLNEKERKMESMRKAVAQMHMAAHLSAGNFMKAVDQFVKRLMPLDIKSFIKLLKRPDFIEDMLTELSSPISADYPCNELDREFRRSFFVIVINLVLAVLRTSGHGDRIGESINGLRMLVEAGLIN